MFLLYSPWLVQLKISSFVDLVIGSALKCIDFFPIAVFRTSQTPPTFLSSILLFTLRLVCVFFSCCYKAEVQTFDTGAVLLVLVYVYKL